MFSSKNEEYMIKKLIQINKKNPFQKLIFIMDNGSKISGIINSFYETDNGFELDEEIYMEYYACTIKVNDGTFKEFGGDNLPKAILNVNGKILWTKI